MKSLVCIECGHRHSTEYSKHLLGRHLLTRCECRVRLMRDLNANKLFRLSEDQLKARGLKVVREF